MMVMTESMDKVFRIENGKLEDEDTSTFLGDVIAPCDVELYELPKNGNGDEAASEDKTEKPE